MADSSSSTKLKPEQSKLTPKFILTEVHGDLFTSAPPNTVLLHACNCRGAWGPVIAAQFKRRFPRSFDSYRRFCNAHKPADPGRLPGPTNPSPLLGSSLLIPPNSATTERYYIACLFTSSNYGKNVDSPERVKESTKRAVRDLVRQLKALPNNRGKRVFACRINSGGFRVPWRESWDIIETTLEEEGWEGTWTVVVPPGEKLLREEVAEQEAIRREQTADDVVDHN